MRAFALSLTLVASTAFADPDVPLRDEGKRVRFGTHVWGGGGGPVAYGFLGADVRLGIQHTRRYSTHAVVLGQLILSGGWMLLGGVAAEFSPIDAVGVSIAPVAGCGRVVNELLVDGPSVCRFKAGFDVRFTIFSGTSKPPYFNRPSAGFAIGLTTVVHELDRQPLGGVGVQFGWTIAPSLALGFDLR